MIPHLGTGSSPMVLVALGDSGHYRHREEKDAETDCPGIDRTDERIENRGETITRASSARHLNERTVE
jgi:hypothetical protein